MYRMFYDDKDDIVLMLIKFLDQQYEFKCKECSIADTPSTTLPCVLKRT